MASDNSGLIKVAAIGVAAYYAYSQGWLSFLGIGTAAAASTPVVTPPAAGAVPPVASPVVAPVVTPPAAPAAPSLDSLGAAIVTAVKGASVGPDDYNYFLTQIYPAAGPLPDPVSLFASTGWARPQPMGFSTYWTITAPWLKANKGLSGYGPQGLGGYAGLGAIAMRRGWGF